MVAIKKHRLARPSASARVSLINLPVEILAEILLLTRSPPTVLAVSRTCSFLHRTLTLNPAAAFIWRGVRHTCAPRPLPAPEDYWKKSEAEYAAFVFGGGPCEVCKRTTRTMYASFAIRVRLCRSWHCHNEYLSRTAPLSLGAQHAYLWVPFVESNICFHPNQSSVSTWPDMRPISIRRADLEKFQHDLAIFKEAEQALAERKRTGAPISEEDQCRERIIERCNAAKRRLPAIMKLSVQLTLWKRDYDLEYETIKQRNQTWTKDLAMNEGWDLKDLIASQTYGSLQRRKNYLLENIVPNDVHSVRFEIESELVEMRARHKRQKAEATYKNKLAEIKKIYEGLRCGNLEGVHSTSDALGLTKSLALPPLSIFLTFSSVRALKGSPDPSAVLPEDALATNKIKSSSLALSLIMSDLHNWLAPVQKYLMSLLGYPNGWQSANIRALPPLERITARFYCRNCGEGVAGGKYQREGCLNLEGVCSHVCVIRGAKKFGGPEVGAIDAGDEHGQQDKDNRNKKKKGTNGSNWSVEQFGKDEKAIRLIKTVLNLCHLSDESPGAIVFLRGARGLTIRCMSCPGWIVMDFETAIGHAHRHECMQIELLRYDDASCVEYEKKGTAASETNADMRLAFERGTSELLLGRSFRAKKLCNWMNYGCKHCSRVEVCKLSGGIERPRIIASEKAKAMSFHGLRSHVKEKHGVRDIRDEDFFCYTPILNLGS